ncbi:MAG: hypothetical protein ACYSWO_26885, partial [Planctomycetota bacterium]
MNKRLNRGIRPVLFVTVALAVVIFAESETRERAWKLGPRMLPVPVDVSDVMRQSLLKTPAPDVAAAKAIVLRT